MNKIKVQSQARSKRFSSDVNEDVMRFSESVSFDKQLASFDIQGSLAHIRMLEVVGLLTEAEKKILEKGLQDVLNDIETGTFAWQVELEDVHMNIEVALISKVGELGKKIHTARSRNDQVALAFRLYASHQVQLWREELENVIYSLKSLAEKNKHYIMPGYTHLQAAQPISVAHHLLAYACQFDRDFDRCLDALKRIDVSPLGACALAGTTHPTRPELVSQDLNWEKHFVNAMDAVSDRDFVLEPLSIATNIGIHLSRLCEDLIIFNSQQYQFISIGDAFTTGSSIMPQKKNPDVAELIRGKSSEISAAFNHLVSLTSSLPMSYNRDLQEDKPPFFRASSTLIDCLKLMADMLTTIEYSPQKMQDALKSGFVNATEMADYLVRKGVPFRMAYYQTGALVSLAEEKAQDNVIPQLNTLTLEELQAENALFEEDIYQYLDYEYAVSQRNSAGGTGKDALVKQFEYFNHKYFS